MELYSWSPGCYGLASWDRETLSIQTYCAFAGVPLNLKHTNNPFWTPGGKFPLFKHKDTVRLTDFEAIVSYLSRCCGFNLDYNLGSKEKSDSVALNKLLEEKLLPALVYSLYANAVNFDVVLRPMLAERLRFPLSFFYIPRYVNEAKALCESHLGSGSGEDEIEKGLMESVFYSNAQDCLDIFAQRLGDRKFLFGEHPSGLDAVLYSYLAPAAKLPLPDNRIKTILNGHANLTQFVENISKSYFLSYLASSSSTATASTSSEGASDAASPSTEAAKMRGNLWALLFAVTAMSGYAYTTGLYRAFKIDFID